MFTPTRMSAALVVVATLSLSVPALQASSEEVKPGSRQAIAVSESRSSGSSSAHKTVIQGSSQAAKTPDTWGACRGTRIKGSSRGMLWLNMDVKIIYELCINSTGRVTYGSAQLTMEGGTAFISYALEDQAWDGTYLPYPRYRATIIRSAIYKGAPMESRYPLMFTFIPGAGQVQYCTAENDNRYFCTMERLAKPDKAMTRTYKNVATGKCLTNFRARDCRNTGIGNVDPYQRWQVLNTSGSNVTLQNVGSGSCIASPNRDKNPSGSKWILRGCSKRPHSQWVARVQRFTHYRTFESAALRGMCLTARPGYGEAFIVTCDRRNKHQQWTVGY